MDPSPIDLQNENTFHLIRLPKETVQRLQEASSSATSEPVGTLIITKEGPPVFQDKETKKTFDLISNNLNVKVQKNDLNDLIEVKLDKKEATHLGKVMPSTIISVPRGDF
jgi:hypothetical protein